MALKIFDWDFMQFEKKIINFFNYFFVYFANNEKKHNECYLHVFIVNNF